jgi:hypothetical protein
MNKPNIEYCARCPNIQKSTVKFGYKRKLCPMIVGGEKSPCLFPKRDTPPVEIISQTSSHTSPVGVLSFAGRVKP